MTREEIKTQIEKLSVAYEKFPISQALFDIWVNSFRDCDFKMFQEAIDETIKNEKYTPNIATVNSYYKQLEAQRRELMDSIRGSYNRAVYALGIEKSADDYKAFLEWLAEIPREFRATSAENFSYDVEKHVRNSSASGKPCKSFIELLEET